MIHHAATLAEERSFAKAAKLLHLSQPAMSRSIIELEKRMGNRLFDRNIGSVVPNEIGRLFLRHGRDLLDKASVMNKEMRHATGPQQGELILGAGVYPMDMFLGEAVGAFCTGHPGVHIRVVNDQARDLIRLLQKRELDLLVGDSAWMEGADDVAAIHLHSHQGCVVARAGHPLAGRKDVTLAMILDHPLVSSAVAASRIASMAVNVMGRTAVSERLSRWLPSVATESTAMMCSTVANSDAITLLPIETAREHVARGKLAILPLELPWLKVRFSVIHLAHRPLSAHGKAFVEAVRKADDALLAREMTAAAQLFSSKTGPKASKPAAGSLGGTGPRRRRKTTPP